MDKRELLSLVEFKARETGAAFPTDGVWHFPGALGTLQNEADNL